ncbi:hypothetical protein PR048_020585 [Dryococelus australis]|uniref:Uncharacterized protein n=1 Tax=Dryococelus australis TaxID=614101 RepID=A0ABQ9H6N0_9NEOP|nr:hypothetical protein PR048_020585 [Dryococelus australis]
MGVKRGGYGTALELKGAENGRSPIKPTDQRHRPARPRWDSNPVHQEIVYGWEEHLKSNPVIPIKTPYDRVKRCQERKINIRASERVNVDDIRLGQYQFGSPLVDDRPIVNAVKYWVVSGVAWTNRTMVSSNTDTNITGVLAVVDIAARQVFPADETHELPFPLTHSLVIRRYTCWFRQCGRVIISPLTTRFTIVWFETRSEIGSKIDTETCCTIRPARLSPSISGFNRARGSPFSPPPFRSCAAAYTPRYIGSLDLAAALPVNWPRDAQLGLDECFGPSIRVLEQTLLRVVCARVALPNMDARPHDGAAGGAALQHRAVTETIVCPDSSSAASPKSLADTFHRGTRGGGQRRGEKDFPTPKRGESFSPWGGGQYRELTSARCGNQQAGLSEELVISCYPGRSTVDANIRRGDTVYDCAVESLKFICSPFDFFYPIAPERGGAVVPHWTRIREDPGSITAPAILISVFHGFPKSLQANAGMGPQQRPWPNPSQSIPNPSSLCNLHRLYNDLVVDETLDPCPATGDMFSMFVLDMRTRCVRRLRCVVDACQRTRHGGASGHANSRRADIEPGNTPKVVHRRAQAVSRLKRMLFRNSTLSHNLTRALLSRSLTLSLCGIGTTTLSDILQTADAKKQEIMLS